MGIGQADAITEEIPDTEWEESRLTVHTCP